MGRGQKTARISARMVEDEAYQLSYERCAGIDVAKASGVVCVRLPPVRDGGKRVAVIETVEATVPAITALGQRLAAAGVQMVSMESTSDYWRIWYYVLEDAGLAVQLVNSSQARQLMGRPKTDLLTELRGEVLQVSGRIASRVATFADHDHGWGSAAGSVAAGGAFARVA